MRYFYIAFLVVKCAVRLEASNCITSISTDKRFPEVGDNVKVIAKYCPENENSTLQWEISGKLVGTCVKTSCSMQRVLIENDPSTMQSTLTILNASIARDNCHVTFKTDQYDDGLHKKINIYKHPENITVKPNVQNKEIELQGEQLFNMSVQTSCMYPRPTFNVYYKDYDRKTHILESIVSSDRDDKDCQLLEMSIYGFIIISSNMFKEECMLEGVNLTVILVYGEYTRVIENLIIMCDQIPNYEDLSIGFRIGYFIEAVIILLAVFLPAVESVLRIPLMSIFVLGGIGMIVFLFKVTRKWDPTDIIMAGLILLTEFTACIIFGIYIKKTIRIYREKTPESNEDIQQVKETGIHCECGCATKKKSDNSDDEELLPLLEENPRNSVIKQTLRKPWKEIKAIEEIQQMKENGIVCEYECATKRTVRKKELPLLEITFERHAEKVLQQEMENDLTCKYECGKGGS